MLGIGAIMSAAVGATFGQSGADALFFARAGVDRLPVMLLISGGLMFGASFVLTVLLGRVAPSRLFVALPLVVAGVVLLERIVVATDVSWIYPVLWLTVGVAQMAQGSFTWGTYGVVVDTRQAKRLFPLFGAGWIVGWVIGGVATQPLASAIGAENLLVVWAAGLVGAFAFGRALLGSARPTPGMRRRSRRQRAGLLEEMDQGLRSVRRSPLLRWMSFAAVLFSVLFFSLYLPFSRAATERYPDADALAGFFGLFSAVTAMAALVWSVFLTGRSFARFGVTTMLLMFPILYFVGFSILIVHAAFATIVAVRFVQMLWLQAVANPAWEAVVNVLPPTRRDQTRAFLNGVPSQAGTVIAGAIQLVGAEALSQTALSAIGAGAAAVMTFACWRVRRSYSAALLDALRAGRPQVFPTRAEEGSPIGSGVDAAAVAALVAGAGEADVRMRRAAVDVLGDVVSDEGGAALGAALRDEDATVRATALRSLARAGLAIERADVVSALSDPVPEVRAAAASVLLRTSIDPDALRTLDDLLRSVEPDDRVAALESLAASPFPEAADRRTGSLVDPSPQVRVAAVHSIGSADPAITVPLLVGCLDDPDPGVRGAASVELGRAGSRAVEPVIDALSDPARADAALRALGRLALGGRDGGREAIVRFAEGQRDVAIADFDAAREIGPAGDGERDAAAGLLRDSLVDRSRARARNALRAAALLDGDPEGGFAIDNLEARDPVQLANALEALETLSATSLVRPLLRLFEPPVPRDTAREAAGVVRLAGLLEDPDPWIRSCAELLHATMEGAPMHDAPTTLSDMERVLFLRKVSLFAELAPRDLTRIAAVAEERTYAEGETIAAQGEAGDELHIVIAGEVEVLRSEASREVELARRSSGDVVGEMALITREPRMASLVAVGDVRTLRVGRLEFESVLRERPDTAIAVIRILSQRLAETAGGRET